MLARALIQRQYGSILRQHSSHLRTLQRNATTAVKSTKPPGARPPVQKSANLSGQELQNFQKTELAAQLFEQGKHVLYTSTWQLSCFRFISFGLVTTIVASLLINMHGGFLDLKDLARRGVSKIVAYTQLGVGVLLSAMAGFIIYRSAGQAESVRLIKKAGAVLVEVRTRQPLPFWKRTDVFRPSDLEAVPQVNRTKYPIPQALQDLKLDTTSRASVVTSVVSNTPKLVARGFFWTMGGFRQLVARASIIQVYGYVPSSETPKIFFLDLHGNFEQPSERNSEPYFFKLLKMLKKR